MSQAHPRRVIPLYVGNSNRQLTIDDSRLTIDDSRFHHTIGQGNLLCSFILMPVSWDLFAASIISNTCKACSTLILGSTPFSIASPTTFAPSLHSYPPLSVHSN